MHRLRDEAPVGARKPRHLNREPRDRKQRDAAQRVLYGGNRSQATVMVFERRSLRLLDTFGEWGSAPGQFGTLHHMAADSKGNLYVTEVTPLRPENRRVQKFVLTTSRSGP